MLRSRDRCRFAPIAPLALQRVLDFERRVFGNYHMVIADQVLKDLKEWTDYYRTKRALAADEVTVILDNGVIELGHSLPPRQLAEAARAIQPTYLVLPDVLGDCHQTIVQSTQFVREVLSLELPSTTKLMGVVQGRSVEEQIECAEVLVYGLKCDALALSRYTTHTLGTRHHTLRRLGRFGVPVHLLGFSRLIYDDFECLSYPWVIGIDSAYPVWCIEPFSLTTYDFTAERPADFWAWMPTEELVDRAAKNIAWAHKLVERR